MIKSQEVVRGEHIGGHDFFFFKGFRKYEDQDNSRKTIQRSHYLLSHTIEGNGH